VLLQRERLPLTIQGILLTDCFTEAAGNSVSTSWV
jgi:hypothetical protein